VLFDYTLDRDQINLQNIQNDTNKKLELILVDHHTLANEDVALKPSVVTIIDHRPLDSAWSWPNVLLNVEIVGSCATLVARNILQKNSDILDTQLSSLLRDKYYLDDRVLLINTKLFLLYNISNIFCRSNID